VTAETAIYLRVRGQVVRILGRSAVLGRSKSCDVQIDEQGVSRRHCEVLLRDDGASVRDLGSTHGVYVDGRRIASEERLRAGVIVKFGKHGPHFEVVNAIVHGRPVLGASPPETTRPVAAGDDAKERTTVAMPAAEPATAAPVADRFLAGLAWGVAAGVAVGIAALALVDFGS
jgi:pSer/pThr/pTyr-binding forkhead associated (FHA) protein